VRSNKVHTRDTLLTAAAIYRAEESRDLERRRAICQTRRRSPRNGHPKSRRNRNADPDNYWRRRGDKSLRFFSEKARESLSSGCELVRRRVLLSRAPLDSRRFPPSLLQLLTMMRCLPPLVENISDSARFNFR
jgi:hypothetical protein